MINKAKSQAAVFKSYGGEMYKVGDIVVHKRDICKISGIAKNYRPGEDYYILSPIDDNSLVIHTPILDGRGLIRSIITKEEAERLIKEIPNIATIEFNDDRSLEVKYNALVNSGKNQDLIQIIKTTYLRREEKEIKGKKVNEKDKNYFRLAEKMFYSELSVALNKTYDETKEYIVSKVTGLSK